MDTEHINHSMRALRSRTSMRWKPILWLLASVLLITGGAWITVLAPDFVRTQWMRQFGEDNRWPGMWAMATGGCYFVPDYRAWANRVAFVGWSTVALGVYCAGVSLRRLLLSQSTG